MKKASVSVFRKHDAFPHIIFFMVYSFCDMRYVSIYKPDLAAQQALTFLYLVCYNSFIGIGPELDDLKCTGKRDT